MKPHLSEYVHLFPELHDVKTEASISCKERFDKLVDLHSIEKVETHNFNFFLIIYINITVISKFLFIRQPDIIYYRLMCSFTVSLSYPRTHPLSSFFPFFYTFLAQ